MSAHTFVKFRERDIYRKLEDTNGIELISSLGVMNEGKCRGLEKRTYLLGLFS